MIHLGDITQIKGCEVPPVDVVIGGSPCQDLSIAGKREGLAGARSGLFMEQIRIVKEMRDADRLRGRSGQLVRPRFMVWENVCFVSGTLVTCDSGYKNIEDVAIGDKVKTLSGEYHSVAACYKTPKVEVMSIKASGSEPLTVTINHPFLAREKSYTVNGQREYGAPKWVDSGKLTKNHMIAYRLDIPTLPDDFISPDVAWALGRWLADGSVDLNRSNPRIFISCGKSKVEATRERLKKLPYEIYENSPHSTAVNFCFTSFEFYRLIEGAGKGAGNKKVPPFVFELPAGLQKAFLDGYLSGDGYSRCRNGSIEFSASTASRELAYGIARVFRNVYHAQATVSRHKAKEGTICGRKIHANYPSYSIGAAINGKCQRWFYENGVIWAPVISVERNGETANVYNLSVIGDNTYGANDIMVHNCGAFSSNKGEDFRAVLEETARIAEPDAAVPRPPKGKWANAGCIVGDEWSLAWRVHDAQFWGVPQRRRRISLVADFGGQAAPEVLFERKGLRWDSSPCGKARQRTPASTERSSDSSVSRVIRITPDGVTYAESESGGTDHTVSHARVYDARGNGNGQVVPTLTGDHENRVTDYTAIVMATGQANAEILKDCCTTLTAAEHEQPIVTVAAVDCRNGTENADVNGTLQAHPNGGLSSVNLNNVVRDGATVRRLTPLEAERLQGYQDNWTDIGEWIDSNGKVRQSSDAARYRALGNSIALPYWKWLIKRISAQYERDATMASLFDGLGGFPYLWEQINGKGSCLWASEIDEFCIAVTKRRFSNVELSQVS